MLLEWILDACTRTECLPRRLGSSHNARRRTSYGCRGRAIYPAEALGRISEVGNPGMS